MEWGSVADWVVAVITGAGFAGAVIQLRFNLADSRAARDQARADEAAGREAMARAVGIKSMWKPGEDGGPPSDDGRIPVEVEVLNSGPYPITSAVLLLPTDDEHAPMEIVYGTVLPGEHLKDMYEVRRSEVVFGELTGGATLLLTDTYGDSWSSSTSWEGLQRRFEPARIC